MEKIKSKVEIRNDKNSIDARVFFYVKIFAVLSMFLIPIKSLNPDSDAWFLAATGRYIVENHFVPKINPFTIHEGYSIIIQQWIPDILNYYIFKYLGYNGTFFVAGLMFFVSMMLVYVYSGFFSKSERARMIGMLIAGIVFLPFANTRPTSISFCVFLLELIIIETYNHNRQKKHILLWLPVLSLLEINSHAAIWPMMFVLIIPYIFPPIIFQGDNIKKYYIEWFSNNKDILLIMLIMLFVGLLNPNGINGMLYLLKSYNNTYGGIQEIQSPKSYSLMGIQILLSTIVITTYIIQNKKNISWSRIYMAVGNLFLAIMHSRNAWCLILGVLPIMLISFSKYVEGDFKAKYTRWEYLLLDSIYIITLIISMSIIMPEIESNYKDSITSPVKAVEYLENKDKKDIILFTEFNNGAFMEWNGYRVYIDARPELFQTEINGKYDLYDEYISTRSNEIDYEKFIEKYSFTHFIVGKTENLNVYLKYNKDYQLVVEGNGYDFYEKKQE